MADHPVATGVTQFLEELRHALDAVEATDDRARLIPFATGIGTAAELVVTQTGAGKKLMFVGNGASAAIASHQAVDFWKTGRMRAVAFNDPAQLTCLGNDYGYAHVFEKPVEMFADPGDVLVAVSSSGRSENIVKAVRMAREKRARVITFSGFAPDNPLRAIGDVNFYVPSKSYGHVEVTHLALLHGLLDAIVAAFGAPPSKETP